MHGCHRKDFGWYGIVDFNSCIYKLDLLTFHFFLFIVKCSLHYFHYILYNIYFSCYLCECLCVHLKISVQPSIVVHLCTVNTEVYTDVKFCLILDCLLGERAWLVKMSEKAERSPSVIWWIHTRCRVRIEVRIACSRRFRLADSNARLNKYRVYILIVRPL